MTHREQSKKEFVQKKIKETMTELGKLMKELEDINETYEERYEEAIKSSMRTHIKTGKVV